MMRKIHFPALIFISLITFSFKDHRTIVSGFQNTVNYGFTDKGDSIEFRFGDQKKIKVGLMSVELDNWRAQIKQVNLAGDFNQWSPSNKAFVLQMIDNKIYKITVHKKLIGKKGEMHQFKFVLNEKYWIEPPADASNKITGSDRNTNFYLKI